MTDSDPRPTLATRLAERHRLRELRAERLARLRAAPPAADEAEAALTDFLRALAGDPPPAPPPAAEPGAVLHFQRPERPAPPSDLDRLPGVGEGLIWALARAGVTSLGDLAGLEAGDLAARLGPIGRLVPAQAWIDAARAAAPA